MLYLYHKEAGQPQLTLVGDEHRYIFKVRRHKVEDVLYLRNLEDGLLHRVVNTELAKIGVGDSVHEGLISDALLAPEFSASTYSRVLAKSSGTRFSQPHQSIAMTQRWSVKQECRENQSLTSVTRISDLWAS